MDGETDGNAMTGFLFWNIVVKFFVAAVPDFMKFPSDFFQD
jgi:hypothetical protein